MLQKLIVPVVAGGILVGSLAVGGAAYAATPPVTATSHATHAGAGAAHRWLRTHRKELRQKGLAISAATIGITPQALAADLKSGRSIAQVAVANGSSATAVEAALTSAADSALGQAEQAGELTAAQVARVEARLPTRVDAVVDHVF